MVKTYKSVHQLEISSLPFRVIFLLQNLFFRGLSSFRDCVTNAHYLLLFKSSRDQGQIDTLARQVMGKDAAKTLKLAYQDSVTNVSRGYLIIDSRADADPRTVLRTKVFPDETPIAYRQPNGKKI